MRTLRRVQEHECVRGGRGPSGAVTARIRMVEPCRSRDGDASAPCPGPHPGVLGFLDRPLDPDAVAATAQRRTAQHGSGRSSSRCRLRERREGPRVRRRAGPERDVHAQLVARERQDALDAHAHLAREAVPVGVLARSTRLGDVQRRPPGAEGAPSSRRPRASRQSRGRATAPPRPRRPRAVRVRSPPRHLAHRLRSTSASLSPPTRAARSHARQTPATARPTSRRTWPPSTWPRARLIWASPSTSTRTTLKLPPWRRARSSSRSRAAWKSPVGARVGENLPHRQRRGIDVDVVTWLEATGLSRPRAGPRVRRSARARGRACADSGRPSRPRLRATRP